MENNIMALIGAIKFLVDAGIIVLNE